MAGEVGEAAAEHRIVVRADVDSVVEGAVRAGDHPGTRDLRLQAGLDVLHEIPSGVLLVHKTADLHVIDGQFGLLEVGAGGGDEVLELLCEERGSLGACI